MEINLLLLWLPLLLTISCTTSVTCAIFNSKNVIYQNQINTANENAIDHQLASNEQLAKEIHNVKTRSANQVYLYSKINSCTRPSDNVLTKCGINYQVPTTILFHNILQVQNYLAQMTRRNQVTYSSMCAPIITRIKCKTLLPRCSEDNTTVYLNDIQEDCNQAAIWCQNATAFPHTDICKQNRSVYNFNRCIKPLFNNPTLCNQPMLPNYSTIPQWLEPSLKQSSQLLNERFRNLLTALGVKDYCITATLTTMCQAIPHCSSDSTELLTTLSESQCEAAVKCLPEHSRAALDVYMSCKVFPNISDSQSFNTTNSPTTTRIKKPTTSIVATTTTPTTAPTTAASSVVTTVATSRSLAATNFVSNSYQTSSNGSHTFRSISLLNVIITAWTSIVMIYSWSHM